MPNVNDMTQYDLISLLKNAAAELVDREAEAMLHDDGYRLALEIVQCIDNYDDYNEARPI